MEAFFGKFFPYIEQIFPERFLVESIHLSILKLLAIVLGSIVLSSAVTHLCDRIFIPTPSTQVVAAPIKICPAPIVCPTPKPRAHWERRWKPTPNNDGQKF